MTDEIFAERLELLTAKVRIGTQQPQSLVILNECCEQIHCAYIWLKMNRDPLSGQFEQLLHEAQDAISDIKQQSNFQTT
jgi:hypothetical protein